MLRKKKTLQENLERMKYVSKYIISETPKYKSLVGNSGMDVLPEYLMKEAPAPEENPADAGTPPADGAAPAADASGLPPLPDAGGADAPAADASGLPALPDMSGGGGGGAPAPAAPAPAAAPAVPPAPSPSASNTNVDITTAQPDAEMGGAPVGGESPEKKVMELQLDALRKMSATMEDLGANIDSLNQRMEVYSSEVDKVREPSDQEKFENRKIDSSPYYFNLNDLWKGENFNSRMDQFGKGYVKTEDGYVADFDDLPKLAPHEVKASFDN